MLLKYVRAILDVNSLSFPCGYWKASYQCQIFFVIPFLLSFSMSFICKYMPNSLWVGWKKRYPIKESSQCLLHINFTSHPTQAVSKNRCILHTRRGCHSYLRAMKRAVMTSNAIHAQFKWKKTHPFRTFHYKHINIKYTF